MSIPAGLTREHILHAMKALGADPALWPERSMSTRYDVLNPDDGTRLPPKLVLSAAAKLATGRELSRKEFSGGVATNDRLIALGFRVVTK